MARPRLHDDALRTRLLEVASRVVADGGPRALTVRDVAARAGTSASAVYALWGGRDELVRAVGEEALRRFAAHLAAAPGTDDPEADLLALGLAYRDSALADPHFYRVMFDTAGAGARGPDAPPSTAQPTFTVLADAVARVLRSHGAPPDVAARAAVPAALTLWGLAHGLVELELSGLLPGDPAERAERFRDSLVAVGGAAVPGAAATPRRPPA
ncbi:TetR/AcrR family transcriptional regulator [Cellulomonas sp. ATA003]|uniref:TetR/AcrR family transcriptional regulator n=1 Tax=Cellulomonas sp. ATA003 TaxID=3073064 RepID=UPI002872D307|nr:TetR/AcrR family transcriptional regulator [Cellulomonas sp. ATA003]WNB84891.1 TetR/AcrR family transcriptional regulator [Cellulomonas sp. ATA003]